MEFIDVQFVMEYCYALIEKAHCSDQFVLNIAALVNKDDFDNLRKKIAAKISNPEEVIKDKQQYYSKIWSYLSAAAELCTEKIIK